MIAIAINVLWFLIGLIILAGIVWLAIWVIEKFIYPIPERVKQGVWVIVLLLALIALLTALVSGGNPFRHLGAIERGPAVAALSAAPAGYLPAVLKPHARDPLHIDQRAPSVLRLCDRGEIFRMLRGEPPRVCAYA